MAVKEGDYFNDKVGFIELVRCPIGQEFCVSHLRKINKFVQHSRGNWISKDYPKAIEELKAAFDQTIDINPAQCARCTKLFRETLIRSMESIHNPFSVKMPGTSLAMGGTKVQNIVRSGAEVVVSNDISCRMHIGGLLQRNPETRHIRTTHIADVLVSGWKDN